MAAFTMSLSVSVIPSLSSSLCKVFALISQGLQSPPSFIKPCRPAIGADRAFLENRFPTMLHQNSAQTGLIFGAVLMYKVLGRAESFYRCSMLCPQEILYYQTLNSCTFRLWFCNRGKFCSAQFWMWTIKGFVGFQRVRLLSAGLEKKVLGSIISIASQTSFSA